MIPSYRQDALTFPLFLRCLCTRLLRLRPIYEVADTPDDCCLRNLAPDIGMEMLTWCVYGPTITAPSSPSVNSLTSSVSLSERKNSSQASHRRLQLENGRLLAESCLVRFSPTSLNIDKVGSQKFEIYWPFFISLNTITKEIMQPLKIIFEAIYPI